MPRYALTSVGRLAVSLSDGQFGGWYAVAYDAYTVHDVGGR